MFCSDAEIYEVNSKTRVRITTTRQPTTWSGATSSPDYPEEYTEDAYDTTLNYNNQDLETTISPLAEDEYFGKVTTEEAFAPTLQTT